LNSGGIWRIGIEANYFMAPLRQTLRHIPAHLA